MKNLKKVLSLALAFAMVLGLCIGASAAQDVTTLKDWSEVENKSAATLLGAFNIMQGDDEGNFRPNDNVTRTEAAKMISVALWGGNDDVALYNAGNIGGYTDVVAGSWYMGYVNYMTVQSIVTGKGEGVFDPNGTVTGYELLKMCLVSLGYSPETEGMTGAGWDVRTMALATKPGFQNLTANTTVTNWNAPLSRTNAAQIIANMIYRETVIYSLTSGVGGNATSRVTGTGTTFAEAVLGMTQRVGTLVANEYGTTDPTKTIDKEAKNYNGENTIVEFAEVKDGTTVVAKALTAKIEMTSTAADVGGKVAAFIVDGKTVVSASIVPSTEVAPKFNKADGKLTNIDKTTDFELTVMINGEAAENGETDLIGDSKIYTVNATTGAMTVNNDAEVKFLDTNDDGYIDTVKAYKYDAVAEVKADDAKTKETGDSYTIGSDKILKSACDFEAKKGDRVAMFEMPEGNVFSATAKSYHGYVLEAVEGKVTRVSAPADGTTLSTNVYVDGVKYTNTVDGLSIGDEGTFYLYANGVIAASAAKSTVVADNYALIYDAGFNSTTGTQVGASSSTSIEVAAVLPDGTDKVFQVAKIFKTTTSGDTETNTALTKDEVEALVDGTNFDSSNTDGKFFADIKAGTTNPIVKYSLNEDGKINLYISKVGAGSVAENAQITTGAAKVDNKFMTSKTVTFVKTSKADEAEKWVVYTGLTVPTGKITSAAATAVLTNLYGSNDGISYMAISELTIGGEKSGLFYVLSTSDIIGTANGKTTYVVDVYSYEDNKVNTNVQYTLEDDTNVGAKGGIYKNFSASNGFTNAVETTGNTIGYITSADNSVIGVTAAEGTTATPFVLTKDTVIIYVDGEDTTKLDIADVDAQMSAADAEAADADTYRVLVVNGTGDNAGNAAIVVVYADVQSNS